MLVHIVWREDGIEPAPLFSFEADTLVDIKQAIFKETHLIPTEQGIYFSRPDNSIGDPVTNESFTDIVQEMQRYIQSNAWSPTFILKKKAYSDMVFKMFEAAHKRIGHLESKIQKLQHELRKR